MMANFELGPKTAKCSTATSNSMPAQERFPLKIFHPVDFGANLSFISASNSYVKATTITECDLIVYPEMLQARKDTAVQLQDISEQYWPYNRKILVFILNDFEKQYKLLDNLILARTSVRACSMRSNELVLPYIWECGDRVFPNSQLSAMPQVGFCGLASPYRKALLKTFKHSKAVRCDFIIRDKFWGGDPHNRLLIDEYYQNMERTQYILCNRGAGNFSMRFYQTMASGRIPVLVNTDMPLPFSDRIPWNELIVFEKNEKRLSDQSSGNPSVKKLLDHAGQM
jgi:hypothetical protein